MAIINSGSADSVDRMLIFVIIIQNLIAAVYATYNRKVAKDFKDLYWHQTASVLFVLYLCALAYALPQGNIQYAQSFEHWPLLLLNGFCFGVGTGIAYLAFRDQDAGVVNTNLMVRVPIAAVLAVIILEQPLSTQNVLGAFLVILGVFVASYFTSTKKSWKPKKSTLYALLAGSLFGIGVISEKLTLNHMDVNTFLVTSWPFEVMFLLLLTLPSLHKWKTVFSNSVIKPTIIMGLIRFVAGFLFIWALENAVNTSLIAAAGGLQAIFTVIIAAIFINERKNLSQKFIAATIACIGVLLMFYS